MLDLLYINDNSSKVRMFGKRKLSFWNIFVLSALTCIIEKLIVKFYELQNKLILILIKMTCISVQNDYHLVFVEFDYAMSSGENVIITDNTTSANMLAICLKRNYILKLTDCSCITAHNRLRLIAVNLYNN